ncbi:MAG: DUF2784 domain-containing protein [Acidobacteria bacterium]|nr:DUF2784 domain-containing protein [Acidobacteriota bacterium]
MIYEIAADLTALLHLGFILFVVFGAILGRRSRRVRALHLAAMTYGVLIEVFYWYCPLTYVEQFFRAKAGRGMYEESFIEHYLNKVIYLDMSQWILIVAAVVVLGTNVALYMYWVWKAGHRAGSRGERTFRHGLS